MTAKTTPEQKVSTVMTAKTTPEQTVSTVMTTKATPEQKVNGDIFLDFLFERRQTMSDDAGKFGERANQPPNLAAP